MVLARDKVQGAGTEVQMFTEGVATDSPSMYKRPSQVDTAGEGVAAV
jgi:hypothetical protein